MNIVKIQKGNPYSATITITTSEGEPYDLTEKTVYFTMKRVNDYTVDITDATAIIRSTCTNTAPFTNGIATLNLSATETKTSNVSGADITLGEYKADFRVYEAGVTQANSESFKVLITDIVTRRPA